MATAGPAMAAPPMAESDRFALAAAAAASAKPPEPIIVTRTELRKKADGTTEEVVVQAEDPPQRRPSTGFRRLLRKVPHRILKAIMIVWEMSWAPTSIIAYRGFNEGLSPSETLRSLSVFETLCILCWGGLVYTGLSATHAGFTEDQYHDAFEEDMQKWLASPAAKKWGPEYWKAKQEREEAAAKRRAEGGEPAADVEDDEDDTVEIPMGPSSSSGSKKDQ